MNKPAKQDTTYNGWKNRQTWNVSLWIQNDEHLYKSAVEYMKRYYERKLKLENIAPADLLKQHFNPYIGFIKSMGMAEMNTPDRIAYLSTRLDYKALNEMMFEFVETK